MSSMDESMVLHRLSDYERRGWISQIDSAQYRSVMNQRRGDAVTLRQISHRLDEWAAKGGTGGAAEGGGGGGNTGTSAPNNKKDQDNHRMNVASPTYTASSTSASSSLYSGATSTSLASTADDPNLASDDLEEDEDEDEPKVEGGAKASVNQAHPSVNTTPAATSTSPYLRSLQCISNLADAYKDNVGSHNKLTAGPTKGQQAAPKGRHLPNQHHVTWKDDDGEAKGKGGTDTERRGNSNEASSSTGPRIVEPSQLWNDDESGTALALHPSLLQELFVEMCFYARLGFVQPPCCLKCTYRTAHSHEGNNHNNNNREGCKQFVVWRKDATSLLHPGTLATNIVLVPCPQAQQLLDGRVASSHYWDAAAKKLRVVKP